MRRENNPNWKKEKMSKNTFQCTLGHPVDLSACWGSQQAVEYQKQQRYQQQHGVRASELRSTVTARKTGEKHVEGAKSLMPMGLQVLWEAGNLFAS